MSSHFPDNQSWNRFWSGERQRSRGGVSWSKRRIHAVISAYVSTGTRVLDAGCGSGYFSKYFFEQGAQVTALDYSEEALSMTRNVTQGHVETIRADLLNDNLALQMQGRNYDVIFSDGLFEHFEAEDQDRILKNFLSVLSDNGRIVTVVPNRWSPWQIIRPVFMPGIVERPFVVQGLIDMHERNGLGIVEKGGLNVFPFKLSPEILASHIGMLVYVITKRQEIGR